ncbi:MAG: 1-(5-phosphoribosyl)-5-[(5-phosphoribosylamino)methylideneamino]imidazole-4-carboxamide isomerase [SAR116 cluster bacterium]|jgi:phosphoribosylformimino-5-aminoimidazole carboxamide ribotide isomerase|nr:MAG: 1-(5-phosphoribosyl)-5-[(5-phosphoribosylamino)methylideneamino]imidazole-4-carboxamide isomerase [SAR116 cluster bacterium]HBQ22543.1 1-(5-phosphoribosyl)-5-[(5-phosphoribosylamino)methylideneamino]imidazole-4-carboxamide isomerase [Alphaproteobacteria bacterium]
MILFPAIDLKDGQCVRLKRGLMDEATVFNMDPVDQALQFEKAGCSHLHMVDLNGAFAGRAVNAEAVKAVRAATGMRMQLGGGIRTLSSIADWLELGVDRVILGTVALKDPDLVREACRVFPGQIMVGIDAKSGHVATEGWAETSNMKATDLGRAFADVGVAAIIFTDIDRDGLLEGVNVDATRQMALAANLPVIASGGVASLLDIDRLLDANIPLLEGVISGRAIYDGRLDLGEALKKLAKN